MRKRTTKKIGILGGTFNPPHKGHLLLAKQAFKRFCLDSIIFMPVGIPALKKPGLAPPKHRLEMTELLIKGISKFAICDYEIQKAGKGKLSYTLETVNYLNKKYPTAHMYWIIGEDSLQEIIEGKWKKSSGLLDLIKFVVGTRPGHNIELNKLPKKMRKRAKSILSKVEKMKLNIPISGTEIRKRIKKGQGLTSLLPKSISNYIKQKGLYGYKSLR